MFGAHRMEVPQRQEGPQHDDPPHVILSRAAVTRPPVRKER